MNQSKKKKKIKWQQTVGFVFMVLVGMAFGLVMAMYLEKYSEDTRLYLFMFAGFFVCTSVAIFFHLILHEVGHMLFGLMTGYTFNSFRVGSFLWVKENGKIKRKKLHIAGTGGQCLMLPPDIKDGKIPFVLYNLGGAIFNIVVSVLFLIGYLLFPNVSVLSLVFLVFALFGVVTALLNGVPMRMGMVDNDGYNTVSMLRSKKAIESFWVQLKVSGQTSSGIRLKDMPAEWFSVPTDEEMKNSLVAACGVFACNRLMDEEKFDEADALMKHLLEIDSAIVGLHRDLLTCDRIYLELVGKNRSAVMDEWMTKEQKNFMKSMKGFPSVLRTQYVLALLGEHDHSKAEAIKKEFEKVAKTYPYPQEIEAEKHLMEIAEGKQT